MLPGALLALALTAVAVFALVLALGIRGEGPLSLFVGGGDGAARLQDREAVAPLGGSPVELGPAEGAAPGVPAVLPAGAGAPAPAAGRTPARRGVPRAGVPGRRTPAQAPNRPAPVRPAPRAQPAPPASSAPQPAPTAAPGPAVKVRGRGTPEVRPQVPKQRTQPAATAAPAPAEPVVEKQVVRPEAPAPTGVGLDDGVLHRVPPGPLQ